MPRGIKAETERQYADIRSDFEKWTQKKYKNVQKFTNSFIFVKLAEKYYKSPKTIESIVFFRTRF